MTERHHHYKLVNICLAAFVIVLLSRLVLMFTGVIWNEINGTNDSFVDLINRWDAGWYHGIVENGYMK